MAYTLEDSELKAVRELNASFRFAITSANHEEDERTGRVRPISSGYVTCDFFDNATGERYASARGIDEKTAFQNTLALAIRSPKPLTQSQRVHMAMNAGEDPRDAEIRQLREQLAKATGKPVPETTAVSTAAPSAGRGARRGATSETKRTPGGVEIL